MPGTPRHKPERTPVKPRRTRRLSDTILASSTLTTNTRPGAMLLSDTTRSKTKICPAAPLRQAHLAGRALDKISSLMSPEMLHAASLETPSKKMTSSPRPFMRIFGTALTLRPPRAGSRESIGGTIHRKPRSGYGDWWQFRVGIA